LVLLLLALALQLKHPHQRWSFQQHHLQQSRIQTVFWNANYAEWSCTQCAMVRIWRPALVVLVGGGALHAVQKSSNRAASSVHYLVVRTSFPRTENDGFTLPAPCGSPKCHSQILWK
jgi:hypothetical protein